MTNSTVAFVVFSKNFIKASEIITKESIWSVLGSVGNLFLEHTESNNRMADIRITNVSNRTYTNSENINKIWKRRSEVIKLTHDVLHYMMLCWACLWTVPKYYELHWHRLTLFLMYVSRVSIDLTRINGYAHDLNKSYWQWSILSVLFSNHNIFKCVLL